MRRPFAMPVALIAAAWLGAVICTLCNAGIINGGLFFSGQTIADGSMAGRTFPIWTPQDTALVVVQWLLQIGVLWQLRAAGTQWRKHPGDGEALSRKFSHLGHAMVLLGVFGACVPVPTFIRLPRHAVFLPQRFGFETLYMLAVGCVCIHGMAHFIREAARLRAENEAFV